MSLKQAFTFVSAPSSMLVRLHQSLSKTVQLGRCLGCPVLGLTGIYIVPEKSVHCGKAARVTRGAGLVQNVDPRILQINLTGFLEKNTSLFVKVGT